MLKSRAVGGGGVGSLLSLRDPDAKKWPRGFIYIDRAQTEQRLNLIHDRGLGSSQLFHETTFFLGKQRTTVDLQDGCTVFAVTNLAPEYT